MGKIVAIGGGGFGLTDKNQISDIYKEILNLSGKTSPNLLFIPTASSDSQEYVESIQNCFGKKLNCNVDVLYLINEKPTFDTIKFKIESADIIYVGGGNTLKMMTLWRKLGVDNLLRQAYQNNKVLCGVSAGSICWFNFGNSDSRKYKNPNANLIKVRGLGLVEALHCPHYDSEKDRKESLKNMMKKYKGMAIAIDDHCALQIIDDQYRVLSSKDTANAYRVYWHKGEFFEEKIVKSDDFLNITTLLKREL